MSAAHDPMTPLSETQRRELDALLRGLSREQLTWVGGYLAGLCAGAGEAPTAGGEALRVTVLYGSQTGNAKAIAERVGARARERGLEVEVVDAAAYPPARLAKEDYLLVVMSTHGEGEPPDSARELHAFLHKRRSGLDGVRFSVLALGDSSYAEFCKAGRDFDERLEALGGERIHPRVDCDLDFEAPAAKWADAVLDGIAARKARSAAVKAGEPASAQSYSRTRPFAATVLENVCLSGRGSTRRVHHLELSLEGSGLRFEAGDTLAVVPCNDRALVEAIAEALDLDLSAPVAVTGAERPLGDALRTSLEVTALTPGFLKAYAALAESERLARMLREADGRVPAELAGAQIVDVVEAFPVRGLVPQRFVNCLRPLWPRLYSIASGPSYSPDEAHLTVARVRYESAGRERHGVASNYLARARTGEKVDVYVQENANFRLPAAGETPIIMVAAGTGIAPFRAFMQERESRGASGRSWLFFGDRNFRTDFLYQREWQALLGRGSLSRMDVAFSRDGERKVYVQDRLREHGRELHAWLEEGAHLYVCGGRAMAEGVHETLQNILGEHGGLSPDAAEAYLNRLARERRYLRDVY